MSVDLNKLNKEELLDFYESIGLNLLPVVKEDKKPIYIGYNHKKLNKSPYDCEPLSYNYLRDFFKKKNFNNNVGVIMGKNSGNLFDIDIDQPDLFNKVAPDFIKKLCLKTLAYTSANGTAQNPNKHLLFRSNYILNRKNIINKYGFELRGNRCYSVLPWSLVKNKENIIKKYQFLNSLDIYKLDETELMELDNFFNNELIYNNETITKNHKNRIKTKPVKTSNQKKVMEKPYGLSEKNFNIFVNGSEGERSNKEHAIVVESFKNFNSPESFTNDFHKFGSNSLKLNLRGEEYFNREINDALNYLLENQRPLTIDIKYSLFLLDILDWDSICYENPNEQNYNIRKLSYKDMLTEIRYSPKNKKTVRFNKKQNVKNVYLCIIFHFLFSGKKKIRISVRNIAEVTGLSIKSVHKIISKFIPKTEVIEVKIDDENYFLYTLLDFKWIDRKFRSFNPGSYSVIASESTTFNPYCKENEDFIILSKYKTFFDLMSSDLFNHKVKGKYPLSILEYCMVPKTYEEIKLNFNKLNKKKLEMNLNFLTVLSNLMKVEDINGEKKYVIIENSNILKEKSDEYYNDLYKYSFGDIAENRKKRHLRDRIAYKNFINKTKSKNEKKEKNSSSIVSHYSIDVTEHY